MDFIVGGALHLLHAFVSPVNCLGNYANEILQATGHLAVCVGNNLSGVATTSGSVVSNVATTVTSIGG